MGSYLTQTGTTGDLTTAMGATVVTRLFADADTTPSQTAIDDVIGRAEAIVNAKCRAVYVVPFVVCPVEVKDATLKLAQAMSWDRKPEFWQEGGRNPAEQLRTLANAFLKDVADETVILDAPTQATSALQGAMVDSYVAHWSEDED